MAPTLTALFRTVETCLALPGASLDSERKIIWHNGLRLSGFSENALLTCTEG
jgi:hypothetical protein